MRVACMFGLVMALALAGCDGAAPEPTIDVTAEATVMIDGWARSGMYLPDSAQVGFFRDNIEALTPLLSAALAHDTQPVRMRAAFVIELCTPPNPALAGLLASRLPSEEDRTVRLYICHALCVHGRTSPQAAVALRTRWQALDKNATARPSSYGYSEAAEAVAVAGALSTCAENTAARKEYASHVLGWLKPPPPDLPKERLADHWDVRWGALATLRSMPPTDGAVPLLNAMLEERDRKSWVETQVRATLQVQEAAR